MFQMKEDGTFDVENINTNEKHEKLDESTKAAIEECTKIGEKKSFGFQSFLCFLRADVLLPPPHVSALPKSLWVPHTRLTC